MSIIEPPEINEVETDEESGYFFVRLGEVSVSHGSEKRFLGSSSSSSIAVASKYGLVFFTDTSSGIYAANSRDLLQNLEKWNNTDEPLPPKDPTSLCIAVFPLNNNNNNVLLSLSPGNELLAVSIGAKIYLFSTHHIVENGTFNPLKELTIETECVQLAWRNTKELTLLTSNGSCIAWNSTQKEYTKYPSTFPETISCISWNNDGSILALGHNDTISLVDCTTSDHSSKIKSTIRVRSQDVVVVDGDDSPSSMKLCVDGLLWLSENMIFITSILLEDDNPTNLAPTCVLSWDRAFNPIKEDLSPENIHLNEFFALNITPPASSSSLDPGSHLLISCIKEWNACLYAHSYAADDHIKICMTSIDKNTATTHAGSGILSAEIYEDAMAIRIPNGQFDAENYIVGMGIDMTCRHIVVHHPTDSTAPDLVPQPVLWAMTSDAVLRGYTFGSLKYIESIVVGNGDGVDAVALPMPPAELMVGESEEKKVREEKKDHGDGVEAAAATALPSDDEFEDEEEIEVVKEEMKNTNGDLKPLTTTQPVFSFAAKETSHASTSVPAFGMPSLSPLSDFDSTVTAANTSASASASTTTTTATAPPITAIATTLDDNNNERPVEKQQQPRRLAPEKSITIAPSPALQLQSTNNPEIIALEKDFLLSLAASRNLETHLHDALENAFKGADDTPGSKPEFDRVRHDVHAVQVTMANARETLKELKNRFDECAMHIKEYYTKIEAMTAFSGTSTSYSTSHSTPISPLDKPAFEIDGVEHSLNQYQPLDPALHALRENATSHLKALSLKLDEVNICLSTLEDRQRRFKSNLSFSSIDPTTQALALYKAVNDQTAVIQSQRERLDGLMNALHLETECMHPHVFLRDDDDEEEEVLDNEKHMIINRRHGSPALFHGDSSKKGRIPWTSFKTTPVTFRGAPKTKSTPSPPPPKQQQQHQIHADGSSSFPPVRQQSMHTAWQGPHGTLLIQDILTRCKNIDGGVRITGASTEDALSEYASPHTAKKNLLESRRDMYSIGISKIGEKKKIFSAAKNSTAASLLPPLVPLNLPELPKPYFPIKKISQSETEALLTTPRAAASSSSSSLSSPGYNSNKKRSPLAAQPALDTSAKSTITSQIPPLPSMAQLQAAAALKSQALPSSSPASIMKKEASKKGAAAIGATAAAPPPLPSLSQVEASKDLMKSVLGNQKINTTTTNTKEGLSVQPPLPTAAAAQARFEAFTTHNKDQPSSSFSAPSFSAAASSSSSALGVDSINFSSFGMSSASTSIFGGGDSSAAAASFPVSAPAPPASVFGSTTTASTAASSPFGTASFPVSSPAPAPVFGSTTTASTAASSPFGTASFPVSSAPAAFGTSFAASTGFGTATTTSTASSSLFGSATTPNSASIFGTTKTSPTPAFGQQQSSAFSPPISESDRQQSPFGGGFGQPSAFGQSSQNVSTPSVFGAPSSSSSPSSLFGSGIGGFGQASAFGQPTAPPATPTTLSTTSPSSGGFGAFANQGATSGFGAFAQQGGGFGGVATTPSPPKPGGSSMWQPRK